MNAVIHHIARMMENAKAVRGHLERRILDPDDCPFGELFLYQTLGDIALPDIGFCQKNQFVIMPVSPTNAFIATIGPYKGDFIWPRSDFPAVREEPNAPDDAVTTTRIMEWAEEESSSRFLYSRKPLYGVVKDCCPRLRPENRTPGLR
jgi:hypothetical protein